MTELFEYKTCNDAITAAADYLFKQIDESEGSILLLLSGGSSLNPVREAFKNIDDETLGRIHIAQVDGRFVEIDDEASNWRQIREAIGPKLDKTASQAVILKQGDAAEDIAIAYEMELRSLLAAADEKIGVYGVGSDGHIAGMLPAKNPADFTQFVDGRLVVDFQGHDFTRITTTQPLLTKLDEVIVFACGPDKVATIERLNEDISPQEHPAQFLKDAERATIFIGESK
jgi:6-phosphogluconolactonase/glucosamine-6-phosphate isomerase/deaminase